MGKRRNVAYRIERFGEGRIKTDEYGHTGRGYSRCKVFRKYVVIDIAGNPLCCFDTQDEAQEAVDTIYPGRRIQEVAFSNRGEGSTIL